MPEIGWNSEGKAEVVVCVAGILVVIASRVGHPRCIGFAQSSVGCLLISDPLAAPIPGIEKASFPPAHIAVGIGSSVLVPNLHSPEVAKTWFEFRTAVRHADRLVR